MTGRRTIKEVFRDYAPQIKNFWLKNLQIKGGQFSATTFIKTNLKKADISNLQTYKGILRVKVSKGKNLRDKIIGALDHIKS